MRRTFKACWSLFRIQVAEGFQYRMAAFSGVATSFIWAVVEVAAFSVFFKYATNAGFAGGLTLEQTVSHIWVRELLLFLQPYSIDEDMRVKINNGDVALEMCRPLDLYWHWFAKGAGAKVVIFVFRCLICFLAGFLLPGGYGARLPVSLEGFVFFILSGLCAFLLCSAFVMFVTAIRVNISWGDAPMFFLLMSAQVLSGGYLPLQLWPDFLQGFLLFQPFAGLCDIPARLYIGSMMPSEAWLGITVQLIWTAAFIVAGKIIMAKRLRGIVAQGG